MLFQQPGAKKLSVPGNICYPRQDMKKLLIAGAVVVACALGIYIGQGLHWGFDPLANPQYGFQFYMPTKLPAD